MIGSYAVNKHVDLQFVRFIEDPGHETRSSDLLHALRATEVDTTKLLLRLVCYD